MHLAEEAEPHPRLVHHTAILCPYQRFCEREHTHDIDSTSPVVVVHLGFTDVRM